MVFLVCIVFYYEFRLSELSSIFCIVLICFLNISYVEIHICISILRFFNCNKDFGNHCVLNFWTWSSGSSRGSFKILAIKLTCSYKSAVFRDVQIWAFILDSDS